MKRLRAWIFRLRGLFRTERQEQELAAEMESHLLLHIDDNLRSGMTPEQARRDAILKLGGVEQTKQAYRDRSTIPFIDSLLRDIRYALRGFRRNPVFTITVIAMLTLGIGSTTAVFSVVDPILFRSLPYAHADRLVSVGLVHALQREPFILGGFYYNWKDNQKPFTALTSQGYGTEQCELTQGNPARLRCIGVEANFLPTLGVAPLLGRNFLPEEDRPNGPKVALISYRLWVSHFNRDPGILNRLIEIDGKPVRVVGVLPKDFEMPTLQAADVLVPNALDEAAERRSQHGAVLRGFARLKPGVSIAQARAELRPLLLSTFSWAPAFIRKQLFLSVRSMRDFQMHNVDRMAWILLGSVLAVLMIACANVASLFMARGATRERELAVRFALGANRIRLIRQTLTEAFLLAAAGAAAGCVLAEILLRVFVAIAPAGILFLNKARLDLRIVLFTVLLSLFCAVLCGLIPALQKPRSIALGGRSINSHAPAVLRRSLVVSQIAISMILLSGAMLLLRSFWSLQEQNLGMRTRHVLTVRVSLSDRSATAQKQMEFYRRAERALRRLPGVTAVGLSDSLPPGGWQNASWSGQIAVEGRPRPTEGAAGSPIVWRWVTPDYFHALDIPIIQGEGFTEEERHSKQQFLILSKQLATHMFPKRNAIGQRIKLGTDIPWYTVVGVAGNVKNSGLTGQNKPEYYRLRRNFIADWDPRSWGIHSVIVLETALSADAVAPWVRSQIAQIDPTAPVDIATLNSQVSKLAARPRFETTLLGFFALSGLLMAIIGLYGVIAFVATQRTQEIGVRMAFGATKFNILRLILREGVRLIALGSLIGMVAALALSHVLKNLLFNISPYNPMSFIAVALLLMLVALGATLVPARSAMKVDPAVALRNE